MRFALRFRPIPFIAALAVAVIGILLGNWQQDRAAYKSRLQQQQLARAAEPALELGPAITPVAQLVFRRVRLHGQFVASWPIFLANRPMGAGSGFYLAMPFKIAGSNTHVLVLRGWLPRQAEFGKLPPFATPSGAVMLEGQVVASTGRVMELGVAPPPAPGALVQNLTPHQLATASGLRLQPFVVQQTAPASAADRMARDWPLPSAGIDKHRGYAVQWYALAALAVLFYVMTGFQRGPGKTDRP